MAQVRLFDLIDIDAVVTDLTIGNIIKPVDQVGDRCLSSAGRTNKGHLLARLCVKGNIVQHRFSRLVGEVNIKEPDVALQAGIGNSSVMMGMLPGPDIGTLRTLLQGTVLFHFGVYQRYVALIRLRLLIQQSKEPVRSGKTHNDHVDLVGHLADGSGKLLRHI